MVTVNKVIIGKKMYENDRFRVPQWSPVEYNIDDSDVELKLKCIISNMVTYEPSKKIPMEEVQKQLANLAG